MAFTTGSVALRGCDLALHRAGSGPPLLYLHGTEGLVEWPSALDSLAGRFAVIAPDHPGFGASRAPHWLDDIADVAYLYLDLIESLGLNRIHLVGHSLGGWIALEMAVRSNHRLASLTLIAPAGIHVKGASKADIFMIDPEEQARLAFADPALAEAAASRAAADKYQDVAIANRMASARLGWHPRFFNPRLARWLHRVRVPTHIVWGDEDRIIPPVYAEAFRSFIPGAEVTMIADAGHLPHVEKPAAVIDSMQDFIARVGEGRRS